MALKRRAWIWIPLVAALGVGIALLPPRTPSGTSPVLGIWPTEELASGRAPAPRLFPGDVDEARRTQQSRVRRAMLVDSILTAARGRHAMRLDGEGITLVYEPGLAADSARFWLHAVARELAVYPNAGSGGMPLVVALALDTAGAWQRDASGYNWRGVRQYLDEVPAAGACVVTVRPYTLQWLRMTVGHDATGQAVTRFLGMCAVYARFGAPGPGVARWAGEHLNYWYGWDQLTSELRDARRPLRLWPIEHAYRSGSSPTMGEVRWLELGCLRGATSACARGVGLTVGAESPFFYYSEYPGGTLERGRIIAHLLATGTAAQFAAFWRSTKPPAQALASAYGAPAGDLALAAVRHWYAVPPAGGPRADARTTLVGAGWVVLALAVAIAAGQRRSTEL